MSIKANYVAATEGTAYRVLGSTMTVKTSADETDGVYEMVVAETRRGADVVLTGTHGRVVLHARRNLDVQIGGRTHHVGPVTS
jgi:predicted thioesterase